MAWTDTYRSKVSLADEAVKSIRSGNRVYIHPGCAVPEVLVDALVRRADELENCEIVHILSLGKAEYVQPGMERHFHHTALFSRIRFDLWKLHYRFIDFNNVMNLTDMYKAVAE